MKKLFPLFLITLLFVTCQDNLPVTITTETSITESIEIQVPQTNGSPHATNEVINENLNNIVANLGEVSELNIDTLSYKFTNANGNPSAEILNATIVINGVNIASISNLNVTQESVNQTVFTISDESILNQIESLFLSTNSISIEYNSSTLSDASLLNFDLEFTLEMTATL